MEKSSVERDLDDWEFLSDDGFLDLAGAAHHEAGKGSSFLRGPAVRGLLDVNYFTCPPSPPHLIIGAAEGLVHSPAKGGKRSETAVAENLDENFIREIHVAPPVMLANQEVVAQVFFRKLGDEKFADMKLESPPRSPTARSLKQHPVREVAGGESEEKGGGDGDAVKGGSCGEAPEKKGEDEGEEMVVKGEGGKNGCWEGIEFNIWKWRVTGLGALCSLGLAAATICIFVLSGRQRQKHQQQIQKLQFQIYHDDKSFKQVMQQATRINQAISVVKGVPMPRAHISFGGYYDGL